jgi:hypothetical protein
MNDGIGLAEALLGLDGFRVLEVIETADEVTIRVETTVDVVGCGCCGTRAEAQDRMPIHVLDLACLGRPTRPAWIKRRWRGVDRDCDAKTRTEHSDLSTRLTVSTCAPTRSSAAATASDPSTTTACASCSTPVGSPGPNAA